MATYSPRQLVRELRRRRVFNTIALYIVGAWVALQVAELALPALEIPDRAIRYVWLASFVLFPLVLAFGWRYDVSTGGIRKTPPADLPADAELPLSGGDRWYIGGLSSLSLAVIASALLNIARTEPEALLLADPAENSLAVLPFEVCEDRPGDRPLAGELSEEVRNRLAERSALKVMMRGSTERLAGLELPRTGIARHLNVHFIVSGEVCRRDGIITVTTELSDRDDYIKDQRRYEQGINDFDQVVSPVASQVADGVAAALGVHFDRVVETPLDRRAYEQFLLSRERSRGRDLKGAIRAMEEALTLEPEFAEALAWKALYTIRGISRGQAAERLEEAFEIGEMALAAVNRQIEYGASSAQTQFVAGFISHELGHWNEMLIFRPAAGGDEQMLTDLRERSAGLFSQAEKHFRTARTLNPSFTGSGGLNIYSYLADTLEHLDPGRRNEALEIYEAGYLLEPWDPYFNASLAQRRAARGRYREAMELLDRFRQLPEVPIRVWWARRDIVLSHGYFDEDCEAQLWIRQNAPEQFATGLETRNGYINFFSWVLPYLGLEEESGAFFERMDDIEELPDWAREHELEFAGRSNEVWESLVGELTEGLSDGEILMQGQVFWAAQALAMTGEEQRAAGLLEAHWTARETGAGWWGTQGGYRVVEMPLLLVELLFKTDRPEDARPVLDKVRHYLEAEHDMGIRHPQTLRYLAETYAFLGRDDDALAMLKKAIDYHLRHNDFDEQVRLHSPWGRFKQEPRFVAQWNRMQTDLRQQAETVRSMLARHDMDDLLAPLMADKSL